VPLPLIRMRRGIEEAEETELSAYAVEVSPCSIVASASRRPLPHRQVEARAGGCSITPSR
jgi:hypothetical protein